MTLKVSKLAPKAPTRKHERMNRFLSRPGKPCTAGTHQKYGRAVLVLTVSARGAFPCWEHYPLLARPAFRSALLHCSWTGPILEARAAGNTTKATAARSAAARRELHGSDTPAISFACSEETSSSTAVHGRSAGAASSILASCSLSLTCTSTSSSLDSWLKAPCSRSHSVSTSGSVVPETCGNGHSWGHAWCIHCANKRP